MTHIMLLTNFDGCHRRASTAGILVIATCEDLTIMRDTQRLVRFPSAATMGIKMPAPFFNKYMA